MESESKPFSSDIKKAESSIADLTKFEIGSFIHQMKDRGVSYLRSKRAENFSKQDTVGSLIAIGINPVIAATLVTHFSLSVGNEIFYQANRVVEPTVKVTMNGILRLIELRKKHHKN